MKVLVCLFVLSMVAYSQGTSYVDLVFVVDGSGSIGIQYWPVVKIFLADIVENLEIGETATRVGLVTFSNLATDQFFLNSHYDKEQMADAIKAVPFPRGSPTLTHLGIDKAKRQLTAVNGERDGYQNVILVLTDGESSDNKITLDSAKGLKDAGCLIISIGIGEQIHSFDEIKNISSKPQTEGKQWYKSADIDELSKLLGSITSAIKCMKPDDRWTNSDGCNSASALQITSAIIIPVFTMLYFLK